MSSRQASAGAAKKHRLTDEHRRILELKYPLCKTLADKRELAKELGITEGDPMVRLYNAAERQGVTSQKLFYEEDPHCDQAAYSSNRLFLRTPANTRWSSYADDYIRRNFRKDFIERTALRLDRSEIAVARRARQLGLRDIPQVWNFAQVSRWLGLAPQESVPAAVQQLVCNSDSLWDKLCFLKPHQRQALLLRAELDETTTAAYEKRLAALAALEERTFPCLLNPCTDSLGRAGATLITTPVLARLLEIGEPAAKPGERKPAWQVMIEQWNADACFIADIRESVAALRSDKSYWSEPWISHGSTFLNPYEAGIFGLIYTDTHFDPDRNDLLTLDDLSPDAKVAYHGWVPRWKRDHIALIDHSRREPASSILEPAPSVRSAEISTPPAALA